MTIFKTIFGKKRIIGYAGVRNSGKTNNIVALVKKFREENKHTQIYIYGFDKVTEDYLVALGNVFVISEINQIIGKTNAIFILDEVQRLKLTDRRYKDLLDSFVDLIYHSENNNYAILCSPNLREFNSVIGNRIDKWVVKSIRQADLINGCPLKKAVDNYKGRFKQLNDLVVPLNQLLILGEETEQILTLDYIQEVDSKKNINDILLSEDCQDKSQEIVKNKYPCGVC
jgi:hypothetical protein